MSSMLSSKKHCYSQAVGAKVSIFIEAVEAPIINTIKEITTNPSYICQLDDPNCPEMACIGIYCDNDCTLVLGKKKCK